MLNVKRRCEKLRWGGLIKCKTGIPRIFASLAVIRWSNRKEAEWGHRWHQPDFSFLPLYGVFIFSIIEFLDCFQLRLFSKSMSSQRSLPWERILHSSWTLYIVYCNLDGATGDHTARTDRRSKDSRSSTSHTWKVVKGMKVRNLETANQGNHAPLWWYSVFVLMSRQRHSPACLKIRLPGFFDRWVAYIQVFIYLYHLCSICNFIYGDKPI